MTCGSSVMGNLESVSAKKLILFSPDVVLPTHLVPTSGPHSHKKKVEPDEQRAEQSRLGPREPWRGALAERHPHRRRSRRAHGNGEPTRQRVQPVHDQGACGCSRWRRARRASRRRGGNWALASVAPATGCRPRRRQHTGSVAAPPTSCPDRNPLHRPWNHPCCRFRAVTTTTLACLAHCGNTGCCYYGRTPCAPMTCASWTKAPTASQRRHHQRHNSWGGVR
jgi:hypothetical protein